MNEINFITGNRNKLTEVEQILDGIIKVQSRQIEEIPEIQGTTEEIARDKCRRAAEAVRWPVCACLGEVHIRKRR